MDKNGVGLGDFPVSTPISTPQVLPVKPRRQPSMDQFCSQEIPHLNGNRCSRCGQHVDQDGMCTCFDHHGRVNMR